MLCNKIKKEKKWVRSKFSVSEQEELRTFFVKNQFPNRDVIRSLSLKFNKTERVIKVWFQNRRQRTFSKNIGKKVNNKPIESDNDLLIIKDNKHKNNNTGYVSISKILSIININQYEELRVILRMLLASYKKEKYPNDIELSSIYHTSKLRYEIIIVWYIYKNNFPNSSFTQDLDILSYLYLFPPKNYFDLTFLSIV